MTVKITIQCDNAAFDGNDLGSELARILADLSNRWAGPGVVRKSELPRTIYDINGNAVGRVTVTD